MLSAFARACCGAGAIVLILTRLRRSQHETDCRGGIRYLSIARDLFHYGRLWAASAVASLASPRGSSRAPPRLKQLPRPGEISARSVISVIIPTFNEAGHIRDTIRAVLRHAAGADRRGMVAASATCACLCPLEPGPRLAVGSAVEVNLTKVCAHQGRAVGVVSVYHGQRPQGVGARGCGR